MATVQMAAPPEDSRTSARRIAGATGIMMAAILASRLLGLMRNGVISYKLGQNFEADGYAGAFQIPHLLFHLIARAAPSSAFIPVFTAKLTLGQDTHAWHVYSYDAPIM